MSFYFLFYFSLGSLKQGILLVPPEHAMHSTSTGLFHSNHWCKPFPPWRLIPQTTPMPAPQLSIFFPPLGFHSTSLWLWCVCLSLIMAFLSSQPTLYVHTYFCCYVQPLKARIHMKFTCIVWKHLSQWLANSRHSINISTMKKGC